MSVLTQPHGVASTLFSNSGELDRTYGARALIQHCPEFHLSSSQFNRFRERGGHPDYRSCSFGLAKFWDLAVLVTIGRCMGRAASTRLSVLARSAGLQLDVAKDVVA